MGRRRALLTVIWGRQMEPWVDKFDGSCLLSTLACPLPNMKSAFAPVAAALLLASNAMAQLMVNTPYAFLFVVITASSHAKMQPVRRRLPTSPDHLEWRNSWVPSNLDVYSQLTLSLQPRTFWFVAMSDTTVHSELTCHSRCLCRGEHA